MNKLTHTNESGKARMVDVGDKDVVKRTAKANGFIKINEEALNLVRDNIMKKGDVLTVAEIAGVQAAKSTSSLIPLSHNINLDHVSVVASIQNEGVQIDSEVSCTGRTGVEMEALTAVSVALLTVYDMCKAVDKKMEIVNVRLIEKKKSVINA